MKRKKSLAYLQTPEVKAKRNKSIHEAAVRRRIAKAIQGRVGPYDAGAPDTSHLRETKRNPASVHHRSSHSTSMQRLAALIVAVWSDLEEGSQ